MWLQQKMNPAPQDPVQAKIFMFFPIFLTVILAPFLQDFIYWVTNNILQMIQQYIVMRQTKIKTV